MQEYSGQPRSVLVTYQIRALVQPLGISSLMDAQMTHPWAQLEELRNDIVQGLCLSLRFSGREHILHLRDVPQYCSEPGEIIEDSLIVISEDELATFPPGSFSFLGPSFRYSEPYGWRPGVGLLIQARDSQLLCAILLVVIVDLVEDLLEKLRRKEEDRCHDCVKGRRSLNMLMLYFFDYASTRRRKMKIGNESHEFCWARADNAYSI